MSIQDMTRNTPLANVSLDTFAIVAAIVLHFYASEIDDHRGLDVAVQVAAIIISKCQQFDWAAHQKEMQLPKGEQ